MTTATEGLSILENEYEEAIADEHQQCYEQDTPCDALDGLVDLMNEAKFQADHPDWPPGDPKYQ